MWYSYSVLKDEHFQKQIPVSNTNRKYLRESPLDDRPTSLILLLRARVNGQSHKQNSR